MIAPASTNSGMAINENLVVPSNMVVAAENRLSIPPLATMATVAITPMATAIGTLINTSNEQGEQHPEDDHRSPSRVSDSLTASSSRLVLLVMQSQGPVCASRQRSGRVASWQRVISVQPIGMIDWVKETEIQGRLTKVSP